MKKFYEAPSMEITKFHTEDVLSPSVPTVEDFIQPGSGTNTEIGGGVDIPGRP